MAFEGTPDVPDCVGPDRSRIHGEDAGGCVTVRFRPSGYVPPSLVARNISDAQQRILALIGVAKDGLALRELKARLGDRVEEWQLKNELAFLKSLDLIELHGRGRGASWKLRGGHAPRGQS